MGQLEQTDVGQALSQEEGCEPSNGEPSTSVVRAPSLVEENKSPCSEATVNEAKLDSNDDTRERKELISSGNAASKEAGSSRGGQKASIGRGRKKEGFGGGNEEASFGGRRKEASFGGGNEETSSGGGNEEASPTGRDEETGN